MYERQIKDKNEELLQSKGDLGDMKTKCGMWPELNSEGKKMVLMEQSVNSV